MREAFKPIPVTSPTNRPVRFWLRCLLDLQLLTIYRYVRPRLPTLIGTCLDVGAGESPWRCLLSTATNYQGLDILDASDFGMQTQPDVVYYDGNRFPFPDAAFDNLFCIEVLEHVPDPQAFVGELARVVRPKGKLILTVPWSARLHHAPHDYTRFTRYALERLFRDAGFSQVIVIPRGNDYAAMANKAIVATMRLMRPERAFGLLLTVPFAILFIPVAGILLLLAHLTMILGGGSADDPLGYGVEATRTASGPPLNEREQLTSDGQ